MPRIKQPLVPLDDEGLGPAMRALNPRQRAFVVGKINGLNDNAAARAAGYVVAAPVGNHGYATHLAHHEGVQAAILEEARKLMRSHGPKSILCLVAIRDDTEAADKDRIKAATELLNRSGFHAVSEHHSTVTVAVSE